LYGMVWYGMYVCLSVCVCVCMYCIVLYCIVLYCMVWYGMVWYGMYVCMSVCVCIVLYCMVWYGMVWYSMVCMYVCMYNLNHYGIKTNCSAFTCVCLLLSFMFFLQYSHVRLQSFQHDVEKIRVVYGYTQIWWQRWHYLWPDLGTLSWLPICSILGWNYWEAEDVETWGCHGFEQLTIKHPNIQLNTNTSVTANTHNGQKWTKECPYWFLRFFHIHSFKSTFQNSVPLIALLDLIWSRMVQVLLFLWCPCNL